MDHIFIKSQSVTLLPCHVCGHDNYDEDGVFRRDERRDITWFYVAHHPQYFWYRVCSECEKLPDLQVRLNVLHITALL